MQAHLQQGQTSIAWLLKVKRVDGTIYGFTTHDQDIAYTDSLDGDTVTYLARTALKPSGESNRSDLSVDNLEALALLDSTSIKETEIRAHLFDDAVITIFMVNWQDLTMSDVPYRRGTLGVVKMINGQFTAELRGLSYRLSTTIGATIGAICRAEFGSGLNGIDVNSKYLCKVDVTQYRQNAHVGSVTDGRTLGIAMDSYPAITPPIGSVPYVTLSWYNDGILTFTSGVLSGQSFEIKTGQYSSPALGLAAIVLHLDILGALPSPGDTCTIEPGCNKTQFDCFNKYNNIANMRAEPFVPGMDQMLNYPNVTSS